MPKKPGKKRIKELSIKWMNHTITDNERLELDAWYNAFDDQVITDLTEEEFNARGVSLYRRLLERMGWIPAKKRRLWPYMAAASVALIVLCGVYVFQYRGEHTVTADVIVPGSAQATLHLDNGKTFALDSLDVGGLIEIEGVVIRKSENGTLRYTAVDEQYARKAPPVINNISTPRGGEYKVILPDGTQVWLNAASSIKFPSYFAENERLVELEGEAYFEVTRNEQAPFRVKTNYETVAVLGTKFNLSAYPEDGVSSTTLVEGSVRVDPLPPQVPGRVLRPGEQAQNHGAGGLAIYPIDITEVLAWKNGEFVFNNERLSTVLEKVARWYDVEITYRQDTIKDIPIWGAVSRYENIGEVLGIIELTEAAKFEIEGRRVSVMK